jgi:hypothetical protein
MLKLEQKVFCEDQIYENLGSALAIIDCVRVLSALDRSTVCSDDLASGDGFANGHKVRDSSMPNALQHAMTLIEHATEGARSLGVMAFETSPSENTSRGTA